MASSLATLAIQAPRADADWPVWSGTTHAAYPGRARWRPVAGRSTLTVRFQVTRVKRTYSIFERRSSEDTRAQNQAAPDWRPQEAKLSHRGRRVYGTP